MKDRAFELQLQASGLRISGNVRSKEIAGLLGQKPVRKNRYRFRHVFDPEICV